ncbi:MAG: type-F conjugative transfer system secretin TraK [Novosphingobium sp.]
MKRLFQSMMPLLALAAALPAHADEFRQGADNARIDCTVSRHELTRIALVGDQFASVSKISSGYPYNDFAVTNEPVRGDIYLSVPETFAAGKLSFFATTRKGFVYKFACTIAAIDAQQVFVTNPALAKNDAAEWEAETPQSASAVRLIQAMANNVALPGFIVRQASDHPVRVGDLELQLVAEYRGAALTGKTIRIVNRGTAPVTLAERDLAPRDAVAVSLGAAKLAPGDATSAFIITSAGVPQP